MIRLPGVTWVLLALLAVGIVLPLVGLRSPATRQTQAAQTPTIPGSEGMITSLRGAPARAISNPRRAAVVSGIAFGRTENISQADSQMFRDSGLWHLLRWVSSGQNSLTIEVKRSGDHFSGGVSVCWARSCWQS